MPLMSPDYNSAQNLRNARAFAIVLLLLVLIASFHLMLTCSAVKSALLYPSRAESEQTRIQRAAFFYASEQLSLSRYLFTGDFGDSAKLEQAHQLLHAVSLGQSQRLGSLIGLEKEWYDNVAQPLIHERQQLDAGQGTLRELQVHYLQLSSLRLDPRSYETANFMDQMPGPTEALRNRLSAILNVRLVAAALICLAALLVALATLRYITKLEEALSEHSYSAQRAG